MRHRRERMGWISSNLLLEMAGNDRVQISRCQLGIDVHRECHSFRWNLVDVGELMCLREQNLFCSPSAVPFSSLLEKGVSPIISRPNPAAPPPEQQPPTQPPNGLDLRLGDHDSVRISVDLAHMHLDMLIVQRFHEFFRRTALPSTLLFVANLLPLGQTISLIFIIRTCVNLPPASQSSPTVPSRRYARILSPYCCGTDR